MPLIILISNLQGKQTFEVMINYHLPFSFLFGADVVRIGPTGLAI